MDRFQDLGNDPASAACDEDSVIEAPPEIADERRMHARAYNHWVSLLHGQACPLVSNVRPENLDDFGPHSMMLDFTGDATSGTIAHLGAALRDECGLTHSVGTVAEIPAGAILGRLTDHYREILESGAPIGFEAEFVNQRGHNALYRGILMPLSSTGERIDFVFGVINWKELADRDVAARIAHEVGRSPERPTGVESSLVWADGPHADPFERAGLTPPTGDFDGAACAIDAGAEPSLDLGFRYGSSSSALRAHG